MTWLQFLLTIPLGIALAALVELYVHKKHERRARYEKGRSFRPPPPLDDDWVDD